jgi:UDPglucose 6-dehydrogenase
MRISVIGTGYVGLVTGVCFTEIGHHVICVDKVQEKIDKLNQDIIPIYEPGLDKLVKRNRAAGRLEFVTDIAYGVANSEIIFIAVGTPPRETGEADLSFIEEVARQVARAMDDYKVVVEKSTVPVKTGEWVERTIRFNNRKGVEFDVVSNPEFLREGSAIEDFMNPDRIVVGVKSERAAELMRAVYEPIIERRHYYDVETGEVLSGPGFEPKAPLIVTNVNSAELIKHASNSFLAMKISYINAVANVCELAGADIEEVAEGMGLDSRIGRQFLNAGVGFGGSCFPKDVVAFYEISKELGYDFRLLKEVLDLNKLQREIFVKKIRSALWIVKGKTIGVLGLAFKPNTDDMREAPSIDIINALIKEGAHVRAYDPQAMDVARRVLPEGVIYCSDPYDAARDCDALVLVTEWEEFRKLDLERIKDLLNYPIVIDGRNIFDPGTMAKLGFEYISIGRK